jgi:hypothetical protein
MFKTIASTVMEIAVIVCVVYVVTVISLVATA